MRGASFFFVREKSKLVSLSCVSCKCLSLSDLNFERDLVRFQRGGKEGRGEKRGDRAKRNDEIHGRGGRFRRPVARSRKRSRREGDSGTVIAGRSEIHRNGGAFSPLRKKKNTTFVRGRLWPN